MALKLFRATGHASILMAGETRAAPHPLMLVLAVSGWIGFGCNAALWRVLSALSEPERNLAWALTAGVVVMSLSFTVLSLLGWRRTFKPVATGLLTIAALAAVSAWIQGLPWEWRSFNQPLRDLLPSIASLLRWQALVPTLVLVLLPVGLLWRAGMRRLPGPEQLRVNVLGTLAGVSVLATSSFVLARLS